MQPKAMWIVGLVLVTALVLPATEYNYNARTRVYVYTMGGNFHLTAAGSGLWHEAALADDGVSLTGGLGFSLLNVHNRFFLNLETDFTSATVRYRGSHGRGVNAWSFMIQGEYRLGQASPVSVYAGIGVGVIGKDEVIVPGIYDDWLRVDSVTEATFAGELGIKVSVARRLMFRAALRFYSVSTGYDDIDYWGGYWDSYLDVWVDDYGSELYATSIMAGLELHF
ncbi:MAG: hypothetical protein JXA62_06920 [Candidatus Aminicenantes bacterium]|nr:hypothetical protein [Candidatus Aminicenantes bacterium]